MHFSKYFINHPFQMRLLFIFTFLIYSVVISLIGFYILNSHQMEATKSRLIQTQKESFDIKAKELKLRIEKYIDELNSLKNSLIFKSYLENKQVNSNITDLFFVMISANSDLSQLRFLDAKGLEKIRFDRKKLGLTPIEIKDKELQNKISRYYFQQIKKAPKDTIWFSKLDLNIEHGELEKPIVPTLRIGTPIYVKDKFEGILIMNIFFNEIIEKFVQSLLFNISIYDENGDFIYHKHKDKNAQTIDYSWSKYLKKNYNLDSYKKNLEKLYKDKSVKDYLFTETISNIIPNEDNLSVYFEPKVLNLRKIEKSETDYAVTIAIIVFLISIPLALIISIIPYTLNRKLYKIKKLLEREANVVNEYVYLSVTDKKGVILNVSKAYEKLTGYKKSELVGSHHNILRDPKTNSLVYEKLWETILSKNVWRGELKNIKKDGTPFYVKNYIKPNLDQKGNIISFTSYIQDITHQKEIEKISITDELTKLYNRREFNKALDEDIAYSKRYKTPFSMIILDIDYFKQFNDTYGHPKGDFALTQVSEMIRKCALRGTDKGFRIGGEEFAVLFSSNTLEDAFNFAEKLRQSVEDLKIEHKTSKVNKYLTISVGVFFKEDIKDFTKEDIYSICDKALYNGKQNGRNQVFLAK